MFALIYDLFFSHSGVKINEFLTKLPIIYYIDFMGYLSAQHLLKQSGKQPKATKRQPEQG